MFIYLIKSYVAQFCEFEHLHAAGLNQLDLPVFGLYLRVISDELLDHALQRLTKVK